MNRAEIGQELNLFEELIPLHMRNRPGTRMRPRSITVHNTSNSNARADADAHSRYVRTKGYYVHNGRKIWTSWHYTVDDTKVIKQLPINEVSYHAGTAANGSSIAIETCMHREINQDQADQRVAKLVAVLLYDLGMGIEDVHTHKKWTGKNCPVLLLADWEGFLAEVGRYLKRMRSSEPNDAPLSGAQEEMAFPDGDQKAAVDDFEIDHAAIAEQIGD